MAGTDDKERLQFLGRADFRDVELLRAEHTPRTWTIFNLGFGFASLRSWNGRVDYRRRRHRAGAGEVFCSEPGEVHCAAPSGANGVGSFDVLQVLPGAFEAQCRAEGLRVAPHFAAIVAKATLRLGGALNALQLALVGDASSVELQSRLAVLVNACVSEVIEPLPRPTTKLPPRAVVERLRELLHSTEGSRIRLLEFAQQAGVSQFKLLRGFKRLYGLPPHAYELNLRVERARHMLRAGHTAAEAAAANDFTDQSHFSRHFRRMWGMTPGQYAR
jgi:AraC-like DNA-binding protein